MDNRKRLILSLLGWLMAFPSPSYATHLCSFHAYDIGQILGHGPNPESAFADAVEKCFDQRMYLAKQRTPQTVDKEMGEAIIDSCVNIRCQVTYIED
jgi:hypothetical protein